jgi:hypothetical protein
MKHVYALLFAVMLTVQTQAQLVVDNTQPAEQIIEDVFLANGIFVSNIVYNGDAINIGAFDGSSTSLGLSNGIVMGSGDVTGAIGPNTSSSFTLGDNTLFGSSDTDLIDILAGYTANDWSIVEFDFIATGDSLDFQFVFGSEEYLEFVNSGFNDGFGFFLSGPGISGPYMNSATNIALIPGTNLPVSINNVNSTMNEAYYVDNGDGWEEPFYSDPAYIQPDGLTTVLHASAGNLTVGEVYHIKLAIADASDSALDSWVFLGGESFVQFCTEQDNFMDEVCLLSSLHADVVFTGECSTVDVINNSDINIDYTNCYFDMGDGTQIDACILGVTHTYTEPGIYPLKLVYEVGEYHAQFKVGTVEISSVPPTVPVISGDQNSLTVGNWNGEDALQWYLNGVLIEGAIYNVLEVNQSGVYTLTYSNSCGSTSSEGFTVVGVAENVLSDVSVYPNPTDGVFFVDSKGKNLLIHIYNHLGQKVYTTQSNGLIQLSLNLASGAYILEIADQQNVSLVRRENLIIR